MSVVYPLLMAILLSMIQVEWIRTIIELLAAVGGFALFLTPFAIILDFACDLPLRADERISGKSMAFTAFLWLIGCIFFGGVSITSFDSSSVGRQYERVARVKGDQRSMTIAIETYNLDLDNYPAWSVRKDENVFEALRDRKGALARIPTFRARNGSELATLTTPTAYLTTLYADPFSPVKGATFGYWTNGDRNTSATGYIVWSAGPDGVYDLTIDNVAKAYDPRSEKSSDMLLNLTYDPSNGTMSRGDIYRTKM